MRLRVNGVVLLVSILFLIMMPTSSSATIGDVFTFLKNDQSLPGPTMSFKTNLCGGVFQFEFKTAVSRALMLYQDNNSSSRDYFELSLRDGRLHLAIHIKDSNHIKDHSQRYWYRSTKRYDDFHWHTVRIELNERINRLFLSIDRRLFYRSSTIDRRLSFSSYLVLGGFPPQRYKELNLINGWRALRLYLNTTKRGYFNACVRDIKYGETGRSLKFIQDIKRLRYYVKEECSLTYCHKPEPFCKNKGVCSIIDGSRDSDKVKCDCRWTGYEGVNCTKDALELTLNGTYQVNYKVRFISAKSEKYKFRIKTTAKNAMILHSKKIRLDKISIQIVDSVILVTSNVGRGTIQLRTKKNVNDNKWHLIEYERYDTIDNNHFILTFDGKVKYGEKRTSSESVFKKMDYDGKMIYLGHNHKAHPPVKLQDLIWRFDIGINHTYNIITTLFESFNDSSKPPFTVTPPDVFPMFNRKLIVRPTNRMSTNRMVAQPTAGVECGLREGSSCPTDQGASTPATGTADAASKAKRGSEDDSSVTWIVVVAVICALILFAVIAFLVHKWNKRFSGDFQVNRKEIGPVGTVVHYKDPGHKEKERQAKI